MLKTTELPSGYPVMDDAEGWGRLNLFAAADGYGAFNGNVIVSMDASQGGPMRPTCGATTSRVPAS